MAGDGALAEEKRGGDFTVCATVGNERCNATFRGCQGCLARTSTDAAELGTGLLNPGDRPKLLEAGERLADRSAGRKLLAFAPANDAQREQRTSTAEVVSNLLMLCDGLFQKRQRFRDGAVRGGHETATPRHLRQHAVAGQPSCIGLPQVDDSDRLVDLPELEQRLDV